MFGGRDLNELTEEGVYYDNSTRLEGYHQNTPEIGNTHPFILTITSSGRITTQEYVTEYDRFWRTNDHWDGKTINPEHIDWSSWSRMGEVKGVNLLNRFGEQDKTIINPTTYAIESAPTIDSALSPHYINVTPGESLEYTKDTDKAWFRTVFYDADRKPIKGLGIEDKRKVIEVPDGAYFMMVSYPTKQNPMIKKVSGGVINWLDKTILSSHYLNANDGLSPGGGANWLTDYMPAMSDQIKLELTESVTPSGVARIGFYDQTNKIIDNQVVISAGQRNPQTWMIDVPKRAKSFRLTLLGYRNEIEHYILTQ